MLGINNTAATKNAKNASEFATIDAVSYTDLRAHETREDSG